MKSGHLMGGIVLGALVGLGIGYLIGVDSEKRNQWLRALSDKVFPGSCSCEKEEFDLEEMPQEETSKK
jgi:hypothetical protein